MGRCLGWCLLLSLNFQAVQGQGQTVPCIDDCLAEALASVPTKGCAAGTLWQPHPLSAPVDSCQPCPPGSYCPGIPYGNFTEHPINLNRPVLCPRGTFRSISGAMSISDCDPCLPGRFSGVLGATACESCAAGTYANTAGSSTTGDCIQCPAGHYCPAGCEVPVPCAAGSYAPLPGLMNQTDCIDCIKGHFCQIGAVDPLECPAGTYGNATGLRGTGSYPGTFLPTPWTDITPSGLYGTDCTACPAPAFCTLGSILPRQCPAGTFLGTTAAEAESECQDCPQGFRCSMPVIVDYEQSDVLRLPNGEPIAGSLGPDVCTEDETVIHHSYPNITGCVEGCPYPFSRQSFCHRAGDGRVPDRTSMAHMMNSFLDMRSTNRPLLMRQAALTNLTDLLENLTSEEAAESLTMLDYNGRSLLHKAAMEDDTEILDVLLQYGGAGSDTINAARDADGFTAIMQALLLENTAAVSWLIAKGATVTSADVTLLASRGVDSSSVPVAEQPSVRYLGRGALAWTGPAAEDFGGLPKESPMPSTTLWEFSTTTVTSTVTATSTTSTTTSTTS